MNMIYARSNLHPGATKAITFTRTCTKCGHVETDVMDFSKEPTKFDTVLDKVFDIVLHNCQLVCYIS